MDGLAGVTCRGEELGVPENLFKILYTRLVSGEVFMQMQNTYDLSSRIFGSQLGPGSGMACGAP